MTNRVPRMPDRLVIDASAALAIVLKEPERPTAEAILRDASGAMVIMVPGHFWLEMANVLGRRHRFDPADIVEAVRALDDLGVRTVEVDRTLWLLALDRMATLGLTAYDAAYLALAEAADASLLTFDARLAAAAGDRALPHGPRRLAEEAAAYAVSPPERVWAASGQYLARLRREVLAG